MSPENHFIPRYEGLKARDEPVAPQSSHWERLSRCPCANRQVRGQGVQESRGYSSSRLLPVFPHELHQIEGDNLRMETKEGWRCRDARPESAVGGRRPDHVNG